jgi:hypothetical protein
MNDIIERKDSELVTSNEMTSSVWYIPYHGVYHPRKSDKLRVVFDCSARFKDQSLNEHLLTGPDLTNSLAGVLCRFRQHPIAIMCNIEKMFHQFIVKKADHDFLRFLWRENGDLSMEPVEYRMRIHSFGTTSSPGCTKYRLKYLAKTHQEMFPLASEFVQNDFYVDDGLTSLDSKEDAIWLIRDSKELCAKGGLRLLKFISNDKNVIDSVPVSERPMDVKDLNLSGEHLPIEQALGVKWNLQNDMLCFKINRQDFTPIQRNILSIAASIFDAPGFLSPVTLTGKRLLQEMCRSSVE